MTLRGTLRRLAVPLHVEAADHGPPTTEPGALGPVHPISTSAIVERLTRARRTLVFP